MINFIKKYYLGAIALVMAIAFACVAIFVERSQNTTNLNAVTEDTVVEISSNSFNYTGIVDYIDDISTEKHDENTDIYYAQAKLCTSLAYLKGYDLTSDDNEDV